MITGTFELPHGPCQIVFVDAEDDIIQLGKSCGLDDISTLHNNFVGPRPRVGGSNYYKRRLVFVALIGSLNRVLSNLAHELGHQHAFDLGVDPTDEGVADMLGDMLIDVYSYDFDFLRTVIDPVFTRSKGGVPTQPERLRGGSPLWLPNTCQRVHLHVIDHSADDKAIHCKALLYVRIDEFSDYSTTIECDDVLQFKLLRSRIDNWAIEHEVVVLVTFEEVNV